MAGRSAVALAAGSLALGLASVLISKGGAHERPAFVVLAILAGVAAAALPLRYGLPVAVVLACFEGFLNDFAGGRALYWNEAFAAGIVLRSLVVRRPSRRELIPVAAVAAVFLGYLVTGTALKADAWGFKVLLTSVVVGWAVARLDLGRPEWLHVYFGLAIVAGSSVVLAVWQRSRGVEGLQSLGLAYGKRIREFQSGGHIRAFAGFTSAAPLSYALAIALCAWIALLVTGVPNRRIALVTAWVPVCAAAGIYLSIDRTAVIALVVAFVAVSVAFRQWRLVAASGVAAAVVVAAALVHGGAQFHGDLGSAAHARLTLWGEYLRDLRPFGAGPASAGSAYDKAGPDDWRTPLRPPNSWHITYDEIEVPGLSDTVVESRTRVRRRLAIVANARSIVKARSLHVSYGDPVFHGSRSILRQRIPVVRPARIAIRVPSIGKDPPSLTLEAPAARPPGPAPYHGELVNLALNPSFELGIAGWHEFHLNATGATVRRTTGQARFGRASLEVVHASELGGRSLGEGAFYAPIAVRRGNRYAFSVYLRGAKGGEAIAFTVNNPGPPYVPTHSPLVHLSKEWRRYALVYTAPHTNKLVDFLIRPWVEADGEPNGRATFYVDGLQIERASRVSAYCDGSVDHCRWAGKRNASRAYRTGATRLLGPLAGPARPGALETIEVRSTARPMPRRAPFTIAIGAERLRVVRVAGPTRYRVERGARGTAAGPHPRGSVVWAEFPEKPRPRPVDPRLSPGAPALTLTDLRFVGLPAPRTHAERVWDRWFDRTPAALEGDGPGLVDNLYVAWVFQYGILGVLLCLAWLAVLTRPLTRRGRGPASIAAALVGVFLIVAAAAVSVWEESPTDLLAALLFAFAFVELRRPEPGPGPAYASPRSRSQATVSAMPASSEYGSSPATSSSGERS